MVDKTALTILGAEVMLERLIAQERELRAAIAALRLNNALAQPKTPPNPHSRPKRGPLTAAQRARIGKGVRRALRTKRRAKQ